MTLPFPSAFAAFPKWSVKEDGVLKVSMTPRVTQTLFVPNSGFLLFVAWQTGPEASTARGGGHGEPHVFRVALGGDQTGGGRRPRKVEMQGEEADRPV
ncbi:uncharacterized protein CLUP02_03105 [Colletotrichum lupini]|uniref:Uncharacterized protein n=1 Tax=Colletotrichum lupini TaxID=145971 RepID=A0A9Q8SIP9_9PEZI|nr:uncharacterized protein CLUP02_03105 [Colletotrichum lupini]UQC77636.1 hypothetical protein CLUP02_03105 [Colletotrichum lupini]